MSQVPANSNVTNDNGDSHDLNEDAAGFIDRSLQNKDNGAIQSPEEGRFRRESEPNSCVIGHKLKLIDREMVVLTVICAQGCKEIKRVFFLKDREDPLVFPVDCKQ